MKVRFKNPADAVQYSGPESIDRNDLVPVTSPQIVWMQLLEDDVLYPYVRTGNTNKLVEPGDWIVTQDGITDALRPDFFLSMYEEAAPPVNAIHCECPECHTKYDITGPTEPLQGNITLASILDILQKCGPAIIELHPDGVAQIRITLTPIALRSDGTDYPLPPVIQSAFLLNNGNRIMIFTGADGSITHYNCDKDWQTIGTPFVKMRLDDSGFNTALEFHKYTRDIHGKKAFVASASTPLDLKAPSIVLKPANIPAP